ncbi:MAG TPA: ABC transporter ATP-binding protein [Polyangia bacterium]|jgi:ABC-2 type transport system ATP-binding protein|nr:ABC transporter ATP-binding protein [Polyangia bacterium]
MTTAPAVVADGLGKIFRPPAALGEMLRGRFLGKALDALVDVSFSVAPGEIVCVMGPNGAGKSTLVRILGGLLMPTSGRADVAGLDVATGGAAFRRRVAFVVGDERSFHYRVSGRANLHYFAALHGLSPAEARHRSSALLERVGLADAADRRYREYSRGMRQRLALARGLLADPQVLLLDEPTLGLDPRGARDLRAFLRDDVIRKPGRTAIVCSNDPTEAKAMADRVLFLEGGRLHADTPPEQIDAELGL